MCGLVALLGTPTDHNEVQTFKDLMTVSCLRGKEGSGIIAVDTKGGIDSTKTVQNAGWLVDSPQADAVLKGDKTIVIGHARWPTKGANTLEMAHPHETASGNIIGVHNGTMHSVNGDYTFAQGSDSLALYESIDKIGLQETINNSYGAYALMYIDKKARTFNVVRNGERTLYAARLLWQRGGLATMYMASERDFLELAVRRRYQDPKGFTYVSIEPHKHYIYPLKPKSNRIETLEVRDATPVRPTYRTYQGGKPNPNAMDWNEVFGSPAAWEEELVMNNGGTTAEQRRSGQKWNYATESWDAIDQNGRVIPQRNTGVDISAANRLNLSPTERQRRMDALRAQNEKEAAKKKPEPFCDLVKGMEDNNTHTRQSDTRDDIRQKGCCVCGEVPDAKERIFPLHASTGVREFLCTDCAKDPDYAIFVAPHDRAKLKQVM